jgi:RimJ/RimL family protein N-acetyltransferase
LRVEHAPEMVAVLADHGLYVYTGEEPPPSLEELTERYERQVLGRSPDGHQLWHNWIVRVSDTGECAGTIQATITGHDAELAWVIAISFHGRGYATEAGTAVRDALLAGRGGDPVVAFLAHIAPGHVASETVARRLGLVPTELMVHGERRWLSLPG